MASVNGASSPFSQQKDLANKKHKDLTDQEKIHLLKREIDNLRGKISDKEHDPYGWKKDTTSSTLTENEPVITIPYKSLDSEKGGFCPAGACFRIPTLSVFMILIVLWVVKVRRRGSFSSNNSRQSSMSSFSFDTLRSSFRPIRNVQAITDGMQFELQEQALTSTSKIDLSNISVNSREEDATNVGKTQPYEAPDAAEVRFV